MGHTRLGTLPKYRPWRQVAAMFAGSGDGEGGGSPPDGDESRTDFGHEVARIAAKAMEGATAALEGAQRDAGIADAC